MTKYVATRDGVCIAYECEGEGAPVLLIHGFGSSRVQNWKSTGWYGALTGAGCRVIAMDCRGHGDSDKPHDTALYAHERMAQDALDVLDAEGISAAPVMGYSMGGFLGLHLLMQAPGRIERLVTGGVGERYLTRGGGMADGHFRTMIADALLAPDAATLTDPSAQMFRKFADQPGKDRLALAACMRTSRPLFSCAQLSRAEHRVLVVCGANDELSGPPGPLAACFPQGRAVALPGRDHMTAVGEIAYKKAVMAFLAEP